MQILVTSNVLGTDPNGRKIQMVAVDDWLFDELSGFDADLKDRKPEADEDDEPCKG